jgi:hypothetical protein
MTRDLLAELRQLDPARDHERIVFLSTTMEFPFDTVRSLELALFRTFAVPSISAKLARTGEFIKRAQKRYDDTDVLISELLEHGYSSERGRAALRRINQIHGRFTISNHDFLYVLSTFVFEPIRWNARFGWRPLCAQELDGLFLFWRAVGERMGIRDIPADRETFEAWSRDFEQRYFQRTEAGERVAVATRDLFASWFPRPLRPLARSAMSALLDQPLRDAVGFAVPSRFARVLVCAGLGLRKAMLRYLPLRPKPVRRSSIPRRSYPGGYRIETIGPAALSGEKLRQSPVRRR